jgi:hypothetical protein
MNTEMQKRALAAREAHLALLDLKKVMEEAAETTHLAEMEAVHLAISAGSVGDIAAALRSVLERLEAGQVEATLSRARQNLLAAMS